jgi:Pyruvate/2-oxoacid:ferredoxin oxidoreductase gamma subunit
MVTYPTILVAMNRPSLEKFQDDVAPDGLIMYDSSLIDIKPSRKDLEIIEIPATKIADELGNTRIANMVVLGALVGCTDILNKESLLATLEYIITRKRLIPINRNAIEKGYEFGRKIWQVKKQKKN